MVELRGMPVVKELLKGMQNDAAALRQKGIVPKLAIVRVGEREDDLAYEKGIKKRFSSIGRKLMLRRCLWTVPRRCWKIRYIV